MPRLLSTAVCLFLLASVLARRPPPPPPPPSPHARDPAEPVVSSVIGRIPSQVGDSANSIVGSVGSEVGSALGNVAAGVGEIPRALGKAVGSVPGAIGRGVGNVGDVGIGEAKKVAEAIGDTVHGASGIVKGLIGGLANGSGKSKRETSPLDGLNLLQHVNLLKTSAIQASDSGLRGVCKLIAILESAVASDDLLKVAPGMIPTAREVLAKVKNTLCAGVNVAGDVQQLVSGVLGQ